ncbi:universal stress protein [Streptomyces sp. NBC_00828]|uniref:universal stress protein n=1 Tax=Streptomyces sp. NBC_00828 TaxID=2903678 RepID=UPI00386CB519
MSSPVVVGVDGMSSSLTMVEAAAREAERHGTGLLLAHAIGWSSDHVLPWDPDGTGLGASVKGTLAEAEHRAHGVAPGVEVTSEVLVGEPSTVLGIESDRASLAVVGKRGPTGLVGRIRGSDTGCPTASCPVLVVRGRPDPAGSVVVGIDGSPTVRDALTFAFDEASLRGADLVVVQVRNAWTRWSHNGSHDASYDGNRPRTGRQRVLAETLAALQKTYPDVRVHHRQAGSRIGSALVDASTEAQLVVVGARKRGLARAARPGSADAVVLREAYCPVAVIGTGKE